MRRVALLVGVSILLAGCSAPLAGSGPVEEPTNGTHDADPASDRLGWERGYWHNESLSINATNGLNESERTALVSRAMARVEYIRQLEFEVSVDITIRSRSNYATGGGSDLSAAFQQFDNAKFEALFLIGDQSDSVSSQATTRNQTIAGYYSPARGDIVLVSDSETPTIDGEGTLAHELTHALQDQHFDLSDDRARTRDAYNGQNGLIEGDARTVENTYTDRCGDGWSCLSSTTSEDTSEGDAGGSERPSIHLGVYAVDYFPYSDGTGFVAHLRDEGGWAAVNEAFAHPPVTSTTVIHPERYGSFEPREVTLEDSTSDGWERVRPANRPDYAVLGQSTMTAMFAYTLYDDYNDRSIIDPQAFLNLDGETLNATDPFEYGLAGTNGWAGDRLHVYSRGEETAYVWRSVWESPADASAFASQYRDLLRHWGGEQVSDGVWRIDAASPFADAYALTVDGDTVTIVDAPSTAALDEVR